MKEKPVKFFVNFQDLRNFGFQDWQFLVTTNLFDLLDFYFCFHIFLLMLLLEAETNILFYLLTC